MGANCPPTPFTRLAATPAGLPVWRPQFLCWEKNLTGMSWQVIWRHRMLHTPPPGAGLARKGGNKYPKKDFPMKITIL